MSKVVEVQAREILDSRGNPTVEVDVWLGSGVRGRAAVPSGASTGKKEALELRDGLKDRYLGKGVSKAVSNVNRILSPEIVGLEVMDQVDIDRHLIALDGTPDKSKLGANAILGVSLAVARAAAEESRLPLYRYLGGVNAKVLPVPLVNLLNGGRHADNNLDVQEVMVVPTGARSMAEAVRMAAEVFHHLKAILQEKGLSCGVGDEGGFAPDLRSYGEAFELLLRAIEQAGYRPGSDLCLALDCAASELYQEGRYHLALEGKDMAAEELVAFYAELVAQYPIISIEDGMAEEDWAGWHLLTTTLGNKVQLVGDDIFATNIELLGRGIREQVANAILIKPNQIGTLTETLDTVRLARCHGYATIVSHRSGETEDSFIADLAVATNTGQIKTGSLSRGERTAKYNQLIRIEEELAAAAVFEGYGAFRHGRLS